MLCQHWRAYTPCGRVEVHVWITLLGIYLGKKVSGKSCRCPVLCRSLIFRVRLTEVFRLYLGCMQRQERKPFSRVLFELAEAIQVIYV